MMTIIFNILIITFSTTYIIGSSGIIVDLSRALYKLTHSDEWKFQLIGKPFGCFVCLSFWLNLIYTLLVGLNFIYCVGLACCMAILSVLFNKLISKILELINKIE